MTKTNTNTIEAARTTISTIVRDVFQADRIGEIAESITDYDRDDARIIDDVVSNRSDDVVAAARAIITDYPTAEAMISDKDAADYSDEIVAIFEIAGF